MGNASEDPYVGEDGIRLHGGKGHTGIVHYVAEAAVAGVGFMAAAMFQEALQRAASDSYDGARRFFTSLRSRLRRVVPQGAEVELIVVQSEEGRWDLLLPGDLDHEAHAALIRDFDDLVRDENDGQQIVIHWADGRWVKERRDGR
ncbi:hypothetical protein [Streptomyces roseolus]|uniref:hypothetical protein n=1 Tax=Streptomyces roseolus TaxID=67358 RepID=UPI0016736292|nr:hypothetical protein [Streptomyces roseolus]GGR51772.1 hypothetical protein GCM10010282_50880 [Streptomyces roseolus]